MAAGSSCRWVRNNEEPTGQDLDLQDVPPALSTTPRLDGSVADNTGVFLTDVGINSAFIFSR